MPISSLAKMTVPIASDSSSTAQGLLMPKLQYRFRVLLENFGVSPGEVTELTKQVMEVSRPNLSFEPITIDLYNSKMYLTGKPVWNEITLQLRDDAVGNVQKLVGEQIQKQFDFMEQSSAASGVDYKFTTKIEILDGGNGIHEASVLELFTVLGCFISSANYNTLNYSTNDPATVSLTIKYDNAIQGTAQNGKGIGTNIGRSIAAIPMVTGASGS